MKINQAGLDLIKRFEGCRLDVYKDVVGLKTVGYGHRTDDMNVGDLITQDQADTLLSKDVEKFEDGVSDLIEVECNENQFSALVCFAFNVGLGALAKSGLLNQLNKGNYDIAADRFLQWANAGGRREEGLVKRREAERALFLS